MIGKEALKRLGNVEVSVTSIRSGMTYFKTLKEQYEKEFEVLEKELFVRDIKPFDVYEEQYKQLEKKYQKLEKENARLHTKIKKLEKELENADEYVWELTKWEYFL